MKTHYISNPTRQTPLSVFAVHHYFEPKIRGERLDEDDSHQTMLAVHDFIFWLGDNPAIGEITQSNFTEWVKSLDASKKCRIPKIRSVLNNAVKRGLTGFSKPIRGVS